jgi:hypothetical protein
MYLEGIVGKEVFEAFVCAYIEKFKFSTVTTGAFRDTFVNFVAKIYIEGSGQLTPGNQDTKKKGKKGKKGPRSSGASVASGLTVSASVLKKVQDLAWIELFTTPGMPKHIPDFTNSLSSKAVKLSQAWIEHMDDADGITGTAEDMKGWSSQQVQIFLEEFLNHSLPDDSSYSQAFLLKLDSAYHFTESHNAEIMFRWQTLCLRSNLQSILPHVVSFITSQGRMKYVRPLYRALGMSSIGMKLAMETFQVHKQIYHPIARKMLESDLTRIVDAHKAEDATNQEAAAENAEDEDGYETMDTSVKSFVAVTGSGDFKDANDGYEILLDAGDATKDLSASPVEKVLAESSVVEKLSEPLVIEDHPWASATSPAVPSAPVKDEAVSSSTTPVANLQAPSSVVLALAPLTRVTSVPVTTAIANNASSPLPAAAATSTGQTTVQESSCSLESKTEATSVKLAVPALAPAPVISSGAPVKPVVTTAPSAATSAKVELKVEPKKTEADITVDKPSFFSNSTTWLTLLALGASLGAFYFLRLTRRK